MANLITRTIISTEVTCLCLNVTTAEPFNKVFALPRTYKTEESMLKKARELYETEEEKIVTIVSYEVVEELRGMTEEFFINNSKFITRPPSQQKKTNINDTQKGDN